METSTQSMRESIRAFYVQRGAQGATIDEAEELLNGLHQSLCPRICELKQDGLLCPNGEQRRTRNGSLADVLVDSNHPTARKSVIATADPKVRKVMSQKQRIELSNNVGKMICCARRIIAHQLNTDSRDVQEMFEEFRTTGLECSITLRQAFTELNDMEAYAKLIRDTLL